MPKFYQESKQWELTLHGSQPSSLPILLLEFLQTSLTQSFLGILQVDETLFDRTIHDETDRLDGPFLSDAMHTIHLRTKRVNRTTQRIENDKDQRNNFDTRTNEKERTAWFSAATFHLSSK
jgi:hypothetical protein